MNVKSLVSNLLVAVSAQGVSLVVSAAMSLLVPKVLGVEEYGYWQLFIFYTSYSGFFHLGLNDGVYLLTGGRRRQDVDKRNLMSQFCVGLVIQFLFAAVIALFTALLGPEGDRSFVLYSTAIYLMLFNASGYLGFLFQAMNETKLYSVSCMLDRLVFLFPMLLMVMLRVQDFRAYVVFYGVSKLISLLFCCWHARDFLVAGCCALSESLRAAKESIEVGSKLMLANIADMLILGIARALVDAVWGIEVFGRVSLSLSLVNFFITFVTQASMVLFPALRQSSDGELASLFRYMCLVTGLFFPAVYILYLPITAIMSAWLPQYAESMHYFAILMPLCVFNTKMNLCGSTYLKVLREERLLLSINILAVFLSTASTLFCVLVLKSLDAVLLGISVAVAIRSLAAERIVAARVGTSGGIAALFEAALSLLFVLSVLFLDGAESLLTYLVVYVAYLIAHKGLVIEVAQRTKRAISGMR